MQLAENLYLQTRSLAAEPVQPTTKGTKIVTVIDVSGSMADDLPAIREQYKFRLSSMVAPEDTVTLIAFSGRGQCWLVFEDEQIAGLGNPQRVTDLQRIHKVIDNRLRPVGLTGFVEPLIMARDVMARIQQHQPDAVFSFFFMSDGHDNQSKRSDILQEARGLGFHAVTVVEFGNYADRATLSQIAEEAGGEFIIAENWLTYAPAFQKAMAKHVTSTPWQTVLLRAVPLLGTVYAIDSANEAIVTFAADNDKVSVPPHIDQIFFLTDTPTGDGAVITDDAIYAGLSVFAGKMKPKIMRALLRAIGDISFTRKFAACYGKAAYGIFANEAKDAAFHFHLRGILGFDTAEEARPDMVTVPEILAILHGDSKTRLYLDSSRFRYKRTGRKAIDASEVLTPKEQAQITAATEALAEGGLEKLTALQEVVSRIAASKKKVNFTADPTPDGVPMRSLEFASTRANLNFGVTYNGTADLTEYHLEKAPFRFSTQLHRSYTVIKDGMINIEALPFSTSTDTMEGFARLVHQGRLAPDAILDMSDGTYILMLSSLPVMNEQSIANLSATNLVQWEYEKLERRADRMVYQYFLDSHFPDTKLAGIADLYGKADAELLKVLGITDSGFNPRSTPAPSEDVYIAKEMVTKLKGYSSLPKVEDVISDIFAGKRLTPPKMLMNHAVRHLLALDTEGKLTAEYLTEKIARHTRAIRHLNSQIASVVFAVIVGQEWFPEFADINEGTITVDVLDTTVTGTIEQKPIEVKI